MGVTWVARYSGSSHGGSSGWSVAISPTGEGSGHRGQHWHQFGGDYASIAYRGRVVTSSSCRGHVNTGSGSGPHFGLWRGFRALARIP
jgi:hypothetical protein